LGAQGAEAVANGAAVVEILLSGDLETWISEFDLEITTVRAKDDSTEEQLGGREWTHIVDLSDGTIVWMEFGSFDGSKSGAAAGLDELERLLR
jgi:hypothetical protein